ncbi:OmpA family protein [Aggregicoccus sp. 17bor-14]|nr:OmpA family protein [Simulacricoccus sp. 17bor-14]MRI90885.1 OmpA family protein [Aggregicoccus sp. 17bor-14]
MSERRSGGGAMPWVLLVGVVALAGALGYFGFEAYSAQRSAHDTAEKLNRELEAKVAELDATRAGQAERLKQLEAQGVSLASERAALAAQVQEKDAQLEALQATYSSLEEKMKAEIKDGEIRLTQANGRLQVDLVDKVLFASGEAALSPRGEEVLARLGTVLEGVKDRDIQVSGHTDDSPPSDKLKAIYPTNWELSVARAVNVVRFLGEKAGVPQRRLVATGHGEYEPVASNATPQGRARNRRIEILLTPEVAAQPAPQVARAAAPAPAVKQASAVKPASAPAKKAVVKAASGTAPRKH